MSKISFKSPRGQWNTSCQSIVLHYSQYQPLLKMGPESGDSGPHPTTPHPTPHHPHHPTTPPLHPRHHPTPHHPHPHPTISHTELGAEHGPSLARCSSQAIEDEHIENNLICHIINLLWLLSDKIPYPVSVTRSIVTNVVWRAFQNTYEFLNLGALKFSHVNKIHIFQCTGMILCV